MRKNIARFWLITLCSFLCINAAFAESEGWPRTFKDKRGTQVLTQAPQRIVSTSVTLTGSLLAIDAPVVASGSTTANNRTSDSQGFFRQWGDIARERGITKIGRGEVSVEMVAMQKPDLILISATGGDSSLAFYDQLSALAPVIVVSYDDKSWQELLRELSRITGHEKQAGQRISEFTDAFNQMKEQITQLPQPVNALVWDSLSQSANVWTEDSAQGQFLTQAGVRLAPMPPSVRPRMTQGKRHDIVPLAGENLVNGLTGNSLLLFAATDNDRLSLLKSPLLSHLPAVAANQVYAMGPETFRLDYYSAMGLVARMKALFAAPAQPGADKVATEQAPAQ